MSKKEALARGMSILLAPTKSMLYDDRSTQMMKQLIRVKPIINRHNMFFRINDN